MTTTTTEKRVVRSVALTADRIAVGPPPSPTIKQRGFAAVGLISQKCPENTGPILRAAHAYSADMVVFQTPRWKPDAQNTSKAELHVPTLIGNLKDLKPIGARVVAVEFIPSAQDLTTYVHPDQAFYVFGPEGGSLDQEVLDWADDVIYVPTQICMNLAATVNVVLYDRAAKRSAKQ